jgi:hypothetical protein
MIESENRPQREIARYDLAIAYRVYPKVSKPAKNLPLGDDKLRLAEVCLRSFRESLGSIRAKIWAILDGCPQEYRVLFERTFPKEDLVIVEVEGIGNQSTFAQQIDILLSQQDAEYVYFAEDDYLYLPDQFEAMLRFLRERGVDFVTPYDHPDCYYLDLHRHPKSLTVFEGHHWRTAASTCLTFLARQSTLARYEQVLRTYVHGNNDCAVWLSLTKRCVFDPFAFFRYVVRQEFYWKILVQAWQFCGPQILFGKTAKLWVPVPGMATHWCANLFSPGFDWFSFMEAAASRNSLLERDTVEPSSIERRQ